jgi:hypothetical protein
LAKRRRIWEEEIAVKLSFELMLDYPRLSPMIGGGSLSLKANERGRERERARSKGT